MKKSIRKIASVVLASALCLSMGMAAFAEDAPSATTEENATAYITKEFQMPEGTTTPSATFTFDITKVSVDGLTTDAAKATMPNGSASITFSSADTGTVAEGSDVKKIVKSTQIFENAQWPHAGVYVYTITEAQSGVTITDDAAETANYSDAQYTATVLVANKADGSGLYVKSFVVTKDKDDAGKEVTPAEGDKEKVDPKPVDPTDPTDPSKGGALRFVNTYTKKINVTPVNPDPDPDNPNANDKGLSVSKTVTGDLGDKTKDFDFSVKIVAPSLATDASYEAKVINADGTVDETLAFASNETKTVKLHDGQELVFTGLYVGTSYEVAEINLDSKYTTTTKSVVNSGTVTTVTADATTKIATVSNKVTEGNDIVAVNNDYSASTPAGILVNNLPFILMIAVAAAGFVAYIAVRRRRA